MVATKTKSRGIVSWPQEERPRERLLSRGAQALTDAELVAILVRVGFKGTSAVELGRQLLKRFGSLRAMVEAPVIALLEVKGLKGAKAAQLLAAMEIARRVAVPIQRSELVIKSTTGAAEYLRERMCGLSEEQFRVLYLNRRHALLEDALIAQGSVESVRPSLRTIVARALQVNASALIAAFKTQIQHRTWGVEDVAEQMFQRLKSIDEESKDAEDREDRTSYAKTFPLETCGQIVRESLQRAMIKAGRITDENRQKFLQALGTLRRKSAKRVVYKLSPQALVALNTRARQAESCSAAELRRGSKTVFYAPGCAATLEDEQREFFREVEDPDGDFLAGRELVGNHSDFKTPANLVIADARPERTFVRTLCERDHAKVVDAWLKNTPVGFYSIQYAWKKGEHPKRGEFSPDFFIKQGDHVFVVEIKGDEEISDPSPENVKKHEFAVEHFQRLNEWLQKDGSSTRYQFNMLTPRGYGIFFTKLREGELAGLRSELDVAMTRATVGG